MRPRDAVVLSVLCPTLIVQYILLWVAATSAYVHFTALLPLLNWRKISQLCWDEHCLRIAQRLSD
eukprot:2419027-Pleurochrysis_carterae.AAC.3